VLALAQRLDWPFVVTFTKGWLPALWQEHLTPLEACSQNRLRQQVGDGRVQQFGWGERLDSQDIAGRQWQRDALKGTERGADGQGQYFVGLTRLPAGRKTVKEIAQNGVSLDDRERGLGRRKNSGLNLGHVSSPDRGKWKAHSPPLPIPFIVAQLLEGGVCCTGRRRSSANRWGRCSAS
jgi:hypothetical protein